MPSPAELIICLNNETLLHDPGHAACRTVGPTSKSFFLCGSHKVYSAVERGSIDEAQEMYTQCAMFTSASERS